MLCSGESERHRGLSLLSPPRQRGEPSNSPGRPPGTASHATERYVVAEHTRVPALAHLAEATMASRQTPARRPRATRPAPSWQRRRMSREHVSLRARRRDDPPPADVYRPVVLRLRSTAAMRSAVEGDIERAVVRRGHAVRIPTRSPSRDHSLAAFPA